MFQKIITALSAAIAVCLFVVGFSACNNSTTQSGSDDCMKGLTDSQKVVIKKMIDLLKDTSKITPSNAFGFTAGSLDKNSKGFSNSTNVSSYTFGYLTDFFKLYDLTEFPVTDADIYYGKYVAEKCTAMEAAYRTEYGHETRSVLVSTDSLYKLVNALYSYQSQSNRKTGVRVVFANYNDRMVGGVKKSGELTYFMVGTIDTVATPATSFRWRNQKDLTILSAGWSIPGWGLSAYNHGELCPQQCEVSGVNTKYFQ